jgi:hypothetical protein
MNRSTNRSVSWRSQESILHCQCHCRDLRAIPGEVWNVAHMALCRELTRMLYYRRLQHVS